MIPREQVLRALRHDVPETLPYELYMDASVRERLDRELGGTQWWDSLIRFFHESWFIYPKREEPEDGRYTDVFGSVWRSGSTMHLEAPVLTTRDVGVIEWPDVDALWREQQPALARSVAEHPDQYRWAALGFGLFERAWTLRGFNEILMDMAVEPAFCEALFDAIMEHQMAVVALLLTLDIDAIFFSDDWAFQRGLIMGPDLWRRYIRPRKEKMIAQVHDAGKTAVLHCCGTVMDVASDIVDIGLDCLQSLQPEAMDVFELKRQYGRDLALWGGGPSQSLIPFGTPEQIHDAFRRLRNELGAGGGYICGPAKPLLSETPLPNAIAAVEGTVGHALARG